MRSRFCGVHFFNPPRYMHLVELIAGHDRRRAARRARNLSRHHARQRRGAREGHAELHRQPRRRVLDAGDDDHTEAFGLGFDVVDALTGPRSAARRARPTAPPTWSGSTRSRTSIKTMDDTLPDDPWHRYFDEPPVLAELIARAHSARRPGGLLQQDRQGHPGARPRGARLSRVGGRGRPRGREILAIEESGARSSPSCARATHPQAQFLWAIFRDLFHYCAFHLAAIADNARDVDLAIRWGFGWQMGPFETWQAAGWQEVAGWIAEDIAAGKAMATCRCPRGSRARSRPRTACTRRRGLLRRRETRSAALVAAGL